MSGYLLVNLRPIQPIKRVALITALLMVFSYRVSAEDIEFNTDILDVHDKANIDLSHFSRAGYIMPGRYTMTVLVNKNEITDRSIEWIVSDDDKKNSIPCLTPELVASFGLKESVGSKLEWFHNGQCLDLKSLPGTQARGDLNGPVLYLNMPQAYLEYRAPNWDPPSQWDDGIAGLLFDYYTNVQTRHDEQGGDSHSVNGNGTTGMNIGPWRVRADWQGRLRHEKSGSDSGWDWSRFYAFRALRSLAAKLTIGEDSLYSDIFDSFRFTGVGLQSDDKMLPPNLRGYAPEVTGVAKTNAKVIISQQGRVLQEVQVAAGPFRIQDLNDMVSGMLDVRVEEQDGTVQTFTVNTATVPYLTRPGQVRYKLAAGRPSDMQHHTDGPEFTSGEFSWGVNNGWSLYGGGVGSKDYQALAVGIGRDLLMFGAMSFDVTRSRASLPDNTGVQQGNSYRLSYSKRFDSTGSQVTFAGYRFSERNFMSMGEYLDARRSGTRVGSSKEMYTITFNQQLPALGVTAYLNYNHQTYWDRPASDRYNLTLSRYFDLGELRNLSLSLTAYRSRYYSTLDNGMYLSLSVPWSNGGSLSYSGAIDRDDITHQVGYSGHIGDRDNYQVSSSLTRQGESFSGNWSREGDVAQIDASGSYMPARYSALSLSMRGGITATTQGAALHRSNVPGGTRMLLDTDGVADIPLKGFGIDTRSNYFGKAVDTDISGFYRSQMSIDLDSLPDNAEAIHSVVQGTLTDGAIGYRKFDVIAGLRAMAAIRMADGSYPPFGATVQNERGQNTGTVADDGVVYLSGMQPGGHMWVSWDDDQQCLMTLPSPLPRDTNNQMLLQCIIDAQRKKTAAGNDGHAAD